MTKWDFDTTIVLSNKRIDQLDADRQLATSREICRRLESQPGVVLADDVGMGKTFVALAVAASVVKANPRRQVVIMVPRAVAEKWPNDWTVFREHCLGGDQSLRATDRTVRRGSDFLKMLDDPPSEMKHIVFITHTALHRKLNDPFVSLAVIQAAFKWQRSLSKQRDKFPRWAARLFNDRRFDEATVRRLMNEPPHRWREIWRKLRDEELGDDPVPGSVVETLPQLDFAGLRNALAAVPLRESPQLPRRLKALRRELDTAVQGVWRDALRSVRSHLPLLILDEAHHVKNPNRLRSLFDSGDGESAEDVRGAFGEVFERMLLLTATPFQLGHRELLSVLRLFDTTRMNAAAHVEFAGQLEELGAALDTAQSSARVLDRLWARLEPEDVAELGDSWWAGGQRDLPDHVARVAQATRAARDTLTTASDLLKPWVIRHTKARNREQLPGVATLPGHESEVGGLPIVRSSVLPFLLAARAQAYVALRGDQEHKRVKALFADGLASSFEAYVATRTVGGAEMDEAELRTDEVEGPDVTWYLDQIEAALPQTGANTWAEHPKIRATVARAMRHWENGEKVLIFCFYRATGKALRRHISVAMQRHIVALARAKLVLPDAAEEEILETLAKRADSFLKGESRGGRLLTKNVTDLGADAGLTVDDTASLAKVVLRFMRTPSFLVRYVDDFGISETDVAIENVLDVPDGANGSGLTLRARLTDFAKRVNLLTQVEREALWGALESIQTGTRRVDETDWFSSPEVDDDKVMLLPNVHLANGATRHDLRQRLMLTFNTPFLPEVLVASSVMAEGVDLHRECRHVIHHDLDWNPSTLEQRTGRVDRIGSKALRVDKKILVCEPYVTGTQDEKQFVVVKDRERWFNVVMGGSVPTGEAETERIAARVPLPEELMRELSMGLSIWPGPRV
jgi:hypothetical protein